MDLHRERQLFSAKPVEAHGRGIRACRGQRRISSAAVLRSRRSPARRKPRRRGSLGTGGQAVFGAVKVTRSSIGEYTEFDANEVPHTLSASFRRSSFLRSFGSSNALRSRIDFGVTSTNSSSWI